MGSPSSTDPTTPPPPVVPSNPDTTYINPGGGPDLRLRSVIISVHPIIPVHIPIVLVPQAVISVHPIIPVQSQLCWSHGRYWATFCNWKSLLLEHHPTSIPYNLPQIGPVPRLYGGTLRLDPASQADNWFRQLVCF